MRRARRPTRLGNTEVPAERLSTPHANHTNGLVLRGQRSAAFPIGTTENTEIARKKASAFRDLSVFSVVERT